MELGGLEVKNLGNIITEKGILSLLGGRECEVE